MPGVEGVADAVESVVKLLLGGELASQHFVVGTEVEVGEIGHLVGTAKAGVVMRAKPQQLLHHRNNLNHYFSTWIRIQKWIRSGRLLARSLSPRCTELPDLRKGLRGQISHR